MLIILFKTWLRCLCKPDMFELSYYNGFSAHMVVVRLLDITDDTVMTKKTVMEPCITNDALLRLIQHPCGNKFIVHLLIPRNTRVFSSKELEFLQAKSTLPTADGDDALAQPLSRKDPAKRRAELLTFLKDPLIKTVRTHIDELVKDRCGIHVVEALVASQWLARDKDFQTELAEAIVGREASLKQADNESEPNSLNQDNSVESPLTDQQLHTSFRRMLKGAGGKQLAPALVKALISDETKFKETLESPHCKYVRQIFGCVLT